MSFLEIKQKECLVERKKFHFSTLHGLRTENFGTYVGILREHPWKQICMYVFNTGKYLSEALIFVSTNPQYDDRLFIELRVQYMKIPRSEHVVYTNCFLFWHSEQFMYTTCSQQHVLSLEFSCTELVIQWTMFCHIVG